MIIFSKSLDAWNSPDFAAVFKADVCKLEAEQLPLQAALAHSSHVSESAIDPVVLNASETNDAIRVVTGIFYAGIIASSCCADDPTPVCEQTEYCELQFDISKATAEVSILLLEN